MENKTSFAQSRSNLSAIHQTSQISFNTTDLTLKDQKWQHWFVTRQRDRPVIRLESKLQNYYEIPSGVKKGIKQ